jgi:O-antigen ligase
MANRGIKKIAYLICSIVLSSLFVEFSLGNVGVNLSVSNVLILTSVFLTILTIIFRAKIKKQEGYLAFIFVLFLNVLLFAPSVQDTGAHISQVITIAKGASLVFVLVYWLDTYREVRTVVWTFAIAGGIAVAAAFAQGYLGLGGDALATQHESRLETVGLGLDIPRSTGLLDSHGLYGSYVSTAALIMATGFIGARTPSGKKNRLLGWGGVLLSTAGVLMSQSRSGLLSVTVGAAAFYILSTYVYTGFTFRRSIPLILLAILFSFAGIDLWHTLTEISERGVSERMLGYYLGLVAFLDSPIMGVGFGSIKKVIGLDTVIHNSFISILVQGGVLGLSVYVYFYWRAIRGAWSCLRADDRRAPLAIALLSCLSAVLVEQSLYNGVAMGINYMLIGLSIALGRARILIRDRASAYRRI